MLSVTLGTLLAFYTHAKRAGRKFMHFLIFLPFLLPP